ncbi:MAG: hypothetical protein HQ523_06335 [Lentisphaerae bacterium]|nr:hypothetical protein [Lentisphaerota bacterium]
MKMALLMAVSGIVLTTGALARDGHDHSETAEAKTNVVVQTTCPVMGGKIKQDLYVDHEGKRVYVCCKGCIAKLQKDPLKYIAKMEAEGVTVAKVQTLCPVMGGKIKKEHYLDHDGKRIYVCCPGCLKKLAAEAAQYIRTMEKEGITLDSTPKPMKHEDKHDSHQGHNH